MIAASLDYRGVAEGRVGDVGLMPYWERMEREGRLDMVVANDGDMMNRPLEIPDGVDNAMTLSMVYPKGRELPTGTGKIDDEITLALPPFERVVVERQG